jgi:hypothetical protein
MVQISAVTSRDFHSVITDVSAAVSDCGGCITGHQFYSNVMAMLAFELSEDRLQQLINILNQLKISATISKMRPAAKSEDIKGQINITFIHNQSDIRRDMPAFDT